MNKIYFVIAVVLLSGLSSCQTYYQRQQKFNDYFRSGQLEKAQEVLSNDRRAQKRRTRLLHNMNMGVVHHMLGNYAQSNGYLEEAHLLAEDFLRNYGEEALAMLTNPKMTEYKGEDFELLMIHYYKALNFIHLGNLDAALVECRRLHNRQNQLNEKFDSENRYRRDAFIHTLTGIIYQAAGEYNNAFTAYRNAYNVYKDDYSRLFGIEAPLQLKKDLLEMAYKNRFTDQVRFYEKEFNMKHTPATGGNHGDVVVFWQNGLGPVKHEWSINFTIVRRSGGNVFFVNEELGLSFQFHSGSSGNKASELGDLRVIRVAFPKYIERKPIYAGARLNASGQRVPLEKAQNINAIAFQSLNDRMHREMGIALTRLALKQAAEELVRRENQNLGAVLSIVNAATEQADTRNWQTLPHSIFYSRMQLPQGQQNISLELIMPNGNVGRTIQRTTEVRLGRTSFMNIHTLDSKLPQN